MPSPPIILVIDDEEDLRYSLERVLSRSGYRIEQAASGEEGLRRAEALRPPVVLLDNRMGAGMNGIETLQHLRSASPQSMVILMTAFGTTQTAIEAMKFGAFDYIIKPFDIPKLQTLVEKALAAYRDLDELEQVHSPLLNSDDYREGIVGSSEAMQEVFKVIGQVAASDVTVMITGESGTGKELVARCIWQHSLRSGRAFIAVNCAAIPENLIESELFGHEKGSFTGATSLRRGKFELCDGGTIFLDEIGDMSLPTQTKILRALQEGEIQRVGGAETTKVDVRLLAATNKDLEKMVAQGTFREDLYYRLNVVRLRLPSLRERRSDIPALVEFMLQKLGREHRIRARRFSPDALALLSLYNWPGNVRELENLVHRSAVVAQGEVVLRKDLPIEILTAVEKKTAQPVQPVQPTQPAQPGQPASAAPGSVPSAGAQAATASESVGGGTGASLPERPQQAAGADKEPAMPPKAGGQEAVAPNVTPTEAGGQDAAALGAEASSAITTGESTVPASSTAATGESTVPGAPRAGTGKDAATASTAAITGAGKASPAGEGEVTTTGEATAEAIAAVSAQSVSGSATQPAATVSAQSAVAQSAAGSAASLGLNELFDVLYAKLEAENATNILTQIESEMMRRALKATGGNQLKTAKLLGITRGTLRKRIEMQGGK